MSTIAEVLLSDDVVVSESVELSAFARKKSTKSLRRASCIDWNSASAFAGSVN